MTHAHVWTIKTINISVHQRKITSVYVNGWYLRTFPPKNLSSMRLILWFIFKVNIYLVGCWQMHYLRFREHMLSLTKADITFLTLDDIVVRYTYNWISQHFPKRFRKNSLKRFNEYRTAIGHIVTNQSAIYYKRQLW